MTRHNDHVREKKTHKEAIIHDITSLKTALLVSTYGAGSDKGRCEEYLDELASLSKTYGFEVKDKIPCPIRAIDAATFIGAGKVEELTKLCQELQADVVIFDDEISPNQQRNLEMAFKKPVVDRTELILEVFAQRAHSKEARLQIELAQAQYQLPRLKRLWTHLSRQAGSAGGGSSGAGGYLKGEGETQIEIDRRIIKKRITLLQKQLKVVRAQRNTQRQGRLKSGVPLFAIVGYTNAGKSTLLNALTNAGVFVEDKLFATLDTTTRQFMLPNQQQILLVDTVGFIRKIPHTLVESFKSTLEEVCYTDILLHLIDVSHPLAEEHAEATQQVLKELGADKKPTLTVLNKVDKCVDKSKILRFKFKYPKTVQISALNKEGLDQLAEMMIQELKSLRKHFKVKIPQSHYSLVSEIMEKGSVLESEYIDQDVLMTIEVPREMEYKVLPFEVES